MPQVVQPQLLGQRVGAAVVVELGDGLVRGPDGELEPMRDELGLPQRAANGRAAARPGTRKGQTMTDASVSFAGNVTDDPEVRYTEAALLD